jgi:hypothetical protein
MNIEKIKQFIELKKELYKEGVIATGSEGEYIQVKEEKMFGLPNLKVIARNSDEYPYEISTHIDGIEFLTVISEDEKHLFPELFEEVESDAV